MVIKKAVFVTSAAKKTQYPKTDLPEIAFAGRSNVGKSSLINMLTKNKSLAKVSGKPGKTRTINFFDIDETWRIVDLPGYGFANVSKAESESWGEMMESYLSSRENLKCVVQLVDIRHAPTAQDVQMYEYLRYYHLSGLVVATKSDKVSNNEKNKNIQIIKKTLELDSSDIIVPVSSMKGDGAKELLSQIEKYL